jgi:hypothetical protein
VSAIVDTVLTASSAAAQRASARGAFEDHPVAKPDRAGVPLDTCPQPDHIGAQQRFSHGAQCAVGELAGLHGMP